MGTLVLEGKHITLPEKILKKFRGKELEFKETEEGVIIKPVKDSIDELMGILKGSRISTKSYVEQKQRDKVLER